MAERSREKSVFDRKEWSSVLNKTKRPSKMTIFGIKVVTDKFSEGFLFGFCFCICFLVDDEKMRKTHTY